MKLVIIGPPGAGKGTQSARIAKKYSIPQLSTGDIFRAALEARTPLGLAAKEALERGTLVDDSIVIGCVAERLLQDDCSNGFILDGFPRTVNQAIELDELLTCQKSRLDCVIEIRVDENILFDRISNRAREALARGEVARSDDNAKSMLRRVAAFNKENNAVTAYYSSKNCLFSVNGMMEIDDVTSQIETLLSQ